MNLTYCITTRKPDGEREGPEVPFATFKQLVPLLANEPDLVGYGEGILELSYKDGYAVVVLNEAGDPVGFTRLQFLFAGFGDSPPWLELGSTWVHHDYRNNGVNRKMYELLLPRHSDKNIFATTTNPASLANGQLFDFVPVYRRQLPQHVWQDSCCCPAWKTKDEKPPNENCILARGEPNNAGHQKSCWFRVTPETAARLGLVV